MKSVAKNNGFSLTEVLMAAGILSVGLMLIATMFPVALYLTGISVERTIGSIVADEAFAKIQLYGIGSPVSTTGDYEAIPGLTIDSGEFAYPSTDPHSSTPQYYWSAVYRKIVPTNPTDPNYQITVFVARKTNAGLTYNAGLYDRPRPMQIQVICTGGSDQITFTLPAIPADAKYFNPPAAIIDDATGKIYRVIDRKTDAVGNPVVTIDRDWEDAPVPAGDFIWLVPPPDSGGKNAETEVYQRIINF